MAWSHYLKCIHEIMSNPEVDNMLREEDIKKEDLPVIWATDPGLPPQIKVGDVIKITRSDGSSYYRQVVPRW
jgi:DNA-directed RNA polymerase subunit H (RpoH/RPB5)